MSDQPHVWRSADRFLTKGDGIVSRHLLSFGGHYDPSRVAIGPLIAHNDEQLAPGAGFADHHHRDVEILTWVVHGGLRHRDSTGHASVIRPSVVQRLSAGRGVTHSEVNADLGSGVGERVRFIQMWLRPDEINAEPSYADHQIDAASLANGFVVVASGDPRLRGQAAVTLGQRSATLFAARLAPGVERGLPASGLLHVFVVSGRISLSSTELAEGDSVTLDLQPTERVAATALATSELLVWSLSHPDQPKGS